MSGSLASITHAIRTYDRETLEIEGFRLAAVLVPLIQRGDRLELLFTVRSAELSSHPGQISFPGGALEPGEDVIAAALRETFEEIGVRVGRSAVIGLLDDHPSPAGYVATPVVAVMSGSSPLRANPAEVADMFVAPLEELREIAPSWEERRVEKFRRRIHYYPWKGRLIWGFTGNVLKNFLEVTAELAAVEQGPPSAEDRGGGVVASERREGA